MTISVVVMKVHIKYSPARNFIIVFKAEHRQCGMSFEPDEIDILLHLVMHKPHTSKYCAINWSAECYIR